MLALFYLLIEGVATIITIAVLIQILTLTLDKNGNGSVVLAPEGAVDGVIVVVPNEGVALSLLAG